MSDVLNESVGHCLGIS